MIVYNERLKKYVRVPYPSKPIGNGKNAGTTRSMIKAQDIQHTFKSKIGVSSIYHRWSN